MCAVRVCDNSYSTRTAVPGLFVLHPVSSIWFFSGSLFLLFLVGFQLVCYARCFLVCFWLMDGIPICGVNLKPRLQVWFFTVCVIDYFLSSSLVCYFIRSICLFVVHLKYQ